MSISSGMVWEVRQTGADTNGGGFRGGANVATPGAPSVSHASFGGSVANGTYFIVVSVRDGNGVTGKSPETSVTTTGTGISTITVTAPTLPAGGSYDIYVGTTTGGPYFSQSTGNTGNVTITATPPTSGTQAPGSDFSQQNAAQVVINNSTITCTTPGANSNTLTFTAGYTPTAADVGNIVQITAGTNINVGFFEITGWTSTTWTLSGINNLTTGGGAGSAITGNMGGALASPSQACDTTSSTSGNVAVNGNIIFVKYNATPYNVPVSGTFNGSGHVLIVGNGIIIQGFDTTRALFSTDANRPTLKATLNSSSRPMVQINNNSSLVMNLICDCNANASVDCFTNGGGGDNTVFYRCSAKGGGTNGFSQDNSNGLCVLCDANGMSKGWKLSNGTCHACVVVNCTATGFSIEGGGTNTLIDCVAIGTTGSSTGVGFNVSGGAALFVNCTAYNNNKAGFGTVTGMLVNCISYGNGTFGYTTVNTPAGALVNCAGGGNTSGNYDATLVKFGLFPNFVALSANPFTNAGGNDFSLNSTAGGGAACKAAGIPGSTTATQLPGLSTLAYPDIGAVQSQAVASTPNTILVG